MRAARRGACGVVRLLLCAGAAVEAADEQGRTALLHAQESAMEAQHWGRGLQGTAPSALQYNGIMPRGVRSQDSYMAGAWAARHARHGEVVRLLLAAGASMQAVSTGWSTSGALAMAQARGGSRPATCQAQAQEAGSAPRRVLL